MGEAGLDKADVENDALIKLTQLERENRKLRREIDHLKNAVVQEKLASATMLNQQKASTFIQRERERYLALLLANSPSIILFLSQTGRVEFCTEHFIAKAGFSKASEILGHTLSGVISRFLDTAAHEKLLEHIQNVIRTNTPFAFDVAFCFDHDASAEEYTGLVVPMKDEEQHSNGIMLMFHDVTDLKRSRKEALEGSKAKSTFLSNMSHEIRTPMNAIIGMTSIGKHEKNLERKDYAFEKIENASKHLLGIINDILDISKIESGKMELSYIAFDFTQMLDRVLSVITLTMQNKRQHFSVEVDHRIPETLFGDDQRLAQVITNILSNASKFTPEEGHIKFAITLLSVENDACVIQMSVKDSGIGISKEERGKLFNVFQQAEAGTARKYGGSGLGLAISKRILELMGGDIWVESEAGKGSCFFFTAHLGIPEQIKSTAGIEQKTGLELDEESQQSYDFSGKVILLVDDIDINLEIIVTLLEPTNITIDTAKSGKEAVDAFVAAPERYDLILMDVQMPGIDGLQATKMIRALTIPQGGVIPIIAMTANVFKEDVEKCLDAGMNDHLGKPIDIDDVIKMLSHYLNPKYTI